MQRRIKVQWRWYSYRRSKESSLKCVCNSFFHGKVLISINTWIIQLHNCLIRQLSFLLSHRYQRLLFMVKFHLPMFASKIILTSFAPSPTASVIFPNWFLTSLTMSAFYFGVTLQQMTEWSYEASVTKYLISSYFYYNEAIVE